ncbi:hypothetical protein E4U41_005896 [Claviceps citrina]|nr:hypothetical protein E4U41_005896 [Claviceps citrina]
MAPARGVMRSLSTRLSYLSIIRRLRRGNDDQNGHRSSEECLLPRPSDDDETGAGPPSRRLSQSSTLCARDSRDLTGTTLAVSNSTGQTRPSTGDHAQPQVGENEHQLQTPPSENPDAFAPAPPGQTESELSEALVVMIPPGSEDPDAMTPAPPSRMETELSEALTVTTQFGSEDPHTNTPAPPRRTESELSQALTVTMPPGSEDPDAITPAPPRRREKELSEVSTLPMPLDLDEPPTLCSFCGGVFGEEKDHGKVKASEILSYLPCGHAFGNICLRRYMSRPFRADRCPNSPCIPLRHMCEHLTMPIATPPAATFNDNSIAVLPWNYEFCSSPKGMKYVRSLAELGSKVRKLEAQKRNRKESAMDFAVNSRIRYYTSSLEQMERRLDDAQKAWWTNRWNEEFEEKKQQGMWSLQRVWGGESG